MNVLVTGGRGLVGRHLLPVLREAGHDAAVLSRSSSPVVDYRVFTWRPHLQELEEEALRWADAVVHLAGANIGTRRWTARRKQELFDSRVQSTRLLLETARRLGCTMRVFVAASAVGYYGAVTRNRPFVEEDPPGKDFLAELCRQWEAQSDGFREMGARVVRLRTGVVLARDGGALPRLMAPVKWGLGSPLGSGKQYFPWIHITDLVRLYAEALSNGRFAGPYNAVAPQQVQQRQFMRVLADVLHRPLFMPGIPAFPLRILLGEFSKTLVEGSPVSAQKILNTGFSYRFPELRPALEDLLCKSGEERSSSQGFRVVR